ncbi:MULTISPECIES: TIGR03619 family F420-dependent LLM class oxidoreductase [Mumia]|uniref:TIGR03619 family F420-dependent LLM class oxidoreductase n=1 Tax=Mumia xiangluensis TaxID=1678900 RepID=A0ABW1QH68_9ACTN|nr:MULTISPECIES: TIGR03619 family F420-dependent LLM class oxidoreductase [Mumia]
MSSRVEHGARRPQLSVSVRNYAASAPEDWRHVLDQARAADDAGIDRIYVSDHVVFGGDLGDYSDPRRGGRANGAQPTGPDGEWMEALTVVSAMAAVTSRVRIGTNVLVAPLRPPVLLAKMAATIDALSHGRFELGVGIGWQQAEYDALGVDYARRGSILDEQLAACRELWTAPVASFAGEHVTFEGIHMMPKPARTDGVPVWLGGSVKPFVARRLAQYAHGWIPWGVPAEDYASHLGEMRALVEAEGGDFDRIQVAYALPPRFTDDRQVDHDALFADVASLVAVGVTDFRSGLRVPPSYEAAYEMFAGLVAAFDRAAAHSPLSADEGLPTN